MGYLVISLKVGQRVMIGNVEVLFSDFDSGHADIAIKAPREMEIRRIPTHAEKEFSNGTQHENHGGHRPRRGIPR